MQAHTLGNIPEKPKIGLVEPNLTIFSVSDRLFSWSAVGRTAPTTALLQGVLQGGALCTGIVPGHV